MRKLRPALIVLLAGVALFATACGTKTSAQKASLQASDNLQGAIYQAKHNIEFRNYNLRQKIADDPSTILWCTFFPPGVQGTGTGSTPGQAITVPVAGKLTSSAKRPYRDGYYNGDGNFVDVPGPDHMYGSSSEYRYGFDPTLTVYYDFTGLASFCTTEPTVWQAQETKIVVNTDATLSSVTKAAEAAIKAGDAQKAYGLLKAVDKGQK